MDLANYHHNGWLAPRLITTHNIQQVLEKPMYQSDMVDESISQDRDEALEQCVAEEVSIVIRGEE